MAEQIERLVAAGDPATVRWLAERLGLFAGLDAAAGPGLRPSRQPEPVPPPSTIVPELDDDGPGLLRERTPPHPAIVAAILARPEADGPKGVYPWTLTPEDAFPNLAPAR